MVSIILTTYNDSHFLKTALPSCLRQSVEKEIIIVDDGSKTQMDPDVVKIINQNGMRYIKHDRNKGLSAARNTGIASAKYDLVIPLDADDFFYDNVVPQMVTVIHDADVVCGNVTDSGLTHYPTISKVPTLQREHFIQDNPLYCSSLFRKKVWNDTGGYTELPHAHYEDWGFWCKAFKKGFRFKYINLTIYEHMSRADGMLRQLHPNRAKYVEIATKELN